MNTLRTVTSSALFFGLFGPAVPLIEIFIAGIALDGTFSPTVLKVYPFALIFGGLFAALIGLMHGVILVLALKLPILAGNIKSSFHLAIFCACIAIICSATFGAYITIVEQNRILATYKGTLEKLKPEVGYWKTFSKKHGVELVLIPSVVCSIAFSLLVLPNPAARQFK